MGSLVSFPPVIVKEGLVAEVAGVAVLGLLAVHGRAHSAGWAWLGLLFRRGAAELRLDVLYEVHPGVFPEGLLVGEDLAAHGAVEHQGSWSWSWTVPVLS